MVLLTYLLLKKIKSTFQITVFFLDFLFRNDRFLKKLRIKQKEHYIVDSIADLMVDFFSNQAEKLISTYGMVAVLFFLFPHLFSDCV